ncbi:MAG: hypothetical protein E4H15_00405 [Syntrophobacterales bacterium]|nr:MAG: hypothetical protein E4H15_00405 [Syntrophobacterales bacterium]
MINKRFSAARFRLINCGLPLAQVHVYWNDKISEGTRFDDLVQTDRVHPVSQGYRIMAEAIMKLFS